MGSKVSRVVPVIDYEPPAFGGPPTLPPTAVVRPLPRPVPAAAAPAEADARAPALFADAALRRVLEVMDRRRPPAQLRPLLAAGLADSLPPVTARHGRTTGPARLRRVLARPVCTGQTVTAAEVAANYVRGDRVGAIACRVEQVATAAGPRWQVVALHIG